MSMAARSLPTGPPRPDRRPCAHPCADSAGRRYLAVRVARHRRPADSPGHHVQRRRHDEQSLPGRSAHRPALSERPTDRPGRSTERARSAPLQSAYRPAGSRATPVGVMRAARSVGVRARGQTLRRPVHPPRSPGRGMRASARGNGRTGLRFVVAAAQRRGLQVGHEQPVDVAPRPVQRRHRGVRVVSVKPHGQLARQTSRSAAAARPSKGGPAGRRTPATGTPR